MQTNTYTSDSFVCFLFQLFSLFERQEEKDQAVCLSGEQSLPSRRVTPVSGALNSPLHTAP